MVPLGTLCNNSYELSSSSCYLHADRAEPEANRNNYILLQTVQHRAALQVPAVDKDRTGGPGEVKAKADR